MDNYIYEKMISYFKKEYYGAKAYKRKESKNRMIEQTLDRCLGVAFFIQSLEVLPYEIIHDEYDKVRRDLEALYVWPA